MNKAKFNKEEWAEKVEKTLHDWLIKVKAVCFWSQDVEKVGNVSCYSVGQEIILIKRYEDGSWDGFTRLKEHIAEGSFKELELACKIGEQE